MKQFQDESKHAIAATAAALRRDVSERSDANNGGRLSAQHD